MIRLLNPLFLFIVICISLLHADQPRFLTVLDQYSNVFFTHEKRSVIFNYITNNNPNIEKILHNDTAVFGNKLQQFALSYLSSKRNHTLRNERSLSYGIGFNSFYDFLDHRPSGSEYYLDTLSYLLEIRGDIVFNFSRYFIKDQVIKKTFFDLQSAIHTQVNYSKKKGYDPDLESQEVSQVLKSDWVTKRHLNSTFFIDISPGIGIGKQINILPVYQVFMLEKKLVKKGVASFQLSEKTLVAIAELLAQNNTYNFKKLEKTKAFKEKIDAIIIKDVAVEKKNLRFISPLDIKKILLCNAPLFMAKPRLTLTTTSRIIPAVTRSETTFPFDSSIYHNDTEFTDIKFHYSHYLGREPYGNIPATYDWLLNPELKFRYEHYLGIKASWGIPLTNIWFLNLKAERNILSTDREMNFYDTKNRINWDEVLDIRFSGQTSLWLANWLMLQSGVTNLPTWLGVPNKGPYYSYLSGNLYVEDYLTLATTCSYFYKSKAHNASSIAWSHPLSRLREGWYFQILVHYNF